MSQDLKREREGVTPASPVPSPGRIVHCVSYGSPVQPDGSQKFHSQCRAAIITETEPRRPADANVYVGLAAINPTGIFFHPLSDGGCPQDEETHRGGTWHWPERT